MSTVEWILPLLVLAALAGFGAWRGLRVARRKHLRRVAAEKAKGHTALRNRMRGLVGRRGRDTLDATYPADTMYGWVWIAMTRRARQPFSESSGWALTRRGARRRLRRYREHQP